MGGCKSYWGLLGGRESLHTCTGVWVTIWLDGEWLKGRADGQAAAMLCDQGSASEQGPAQAQRQSPERDCDVPGTLAPRAALGRPAFMCRKEPDTGCFCYRCNLNSSTAAETPWSCAANVVGACPAA